MLNWLIKKQNSLLYIVYINIRHLNSNGVQFLFYLFNYFIWFDYFYLCVCVEKIINPKNSIQFVLGSQSFSTTTSSLNFMNTFLKLSARCCGNHGTSRWVVKKSSPKSNSIGNWQGGMKFKPKSDCNCTIVIPFDIPQI